MTTKPAVKCCRLIAEPTEDEPGLVRVEDGRDVAFYFLDRQPGAPGHDDLYLVEKLGRPGVTYRVRVGAGLLGGCDCRANVFRRVCKHTRVVRALVKAGKLPAPAGKDVA